LIGWFVTIFVAFWNEVVVFLYNLIGVLLGKLL
jgi:hypothetical protein